eukprot:3491505-Rhodomonas_salina.1
MPRPGGGHVRHQHAQLRREEKQEVEQEELELGRKTGGGIRKRPRKTRRGRWGLTIVGYRGSYGSLWKGSFPAKCPMDSSSYGNKKPFTFVFTSAPSSSCGRMPGGEESGGRKGGERGGGRVQSREREHTVGFRGGRGRESRVKGRVREGRLG